MTPKQLAAHRLMLQKLRSRLLQSGPAKIEPNRTDDATAGVADEDAQALSEMLQVLSSERNKEQAALVARIDRALRRLAQTPEDFGLCEECEEEIPEKRLALMPYATLCAQCQSKRDPKRGTTRRKVTDFR